MVYFASKLVSLSTWHWPNHQQKVPNKESCGQNLPQKFVGGPKTPVKNWIRPTSIFTATMPNLEDIRLMAHAADTVLRRCLQRTGQGIRIYSYNLYSCMFWF